MSIPRHSNTGSDDPAATATGFELGLSESPWLGHGLGGLIENRTIWSPAESYFAWVAIIFPSIKDMEAALTAFKKTKSGALCPEFRSLSTLFLPKDGYGTLEYLFDTRPKAMTGGRPVKSVAVYHTACIHPDFLAAMPSHKANTKRARELWFCATLKGHDMRRERSEIFFVAETTDQLMKEFMKDAVKLNTMP